MNVEWPIMQMLTYSDGRLATFVFKHTIIQRLIRLFLVITSATYNWLSQEAYWVDRLCPTLVASCTHDQRHAHRPLPLFYPCSNNTVWKAYQGHAYSIQSKVSTGNCSVTATGPPWRETLPA